MLFIFVVTVFPVSKSHYFVCVLASFIIVYNAITYNILDIYATLKILILFWLFVIKPWSCILGNQCSVAGFSHWHSDG